jgi:diguanylate cyclase (GGDEF)-like protein
MAYAVPPLESMATTDKKMGESLDHSLAKVPAYREELQIALEELGRTRAALRWAEQRYFVLVEALEDGILLLDRSGRTSTVNPSARMYVGDEAAIERWLWGDNPTRRTPGMHPATETLIDGKPRTGIEMPLQGPDSKLRWLNVNSRAVFDMDKGHVAAVLCSFADISTHKALEAELEKQATIDSLTGVYNRRYIERRLSEEVNRAQRTAHPLALAVLDIDAFKSVNDRYGHAGGDVALKKFAEALNMGVRGQDLVARLGGDEFCVILPNADAAKAAVALERCLDLIARSELEIDGKRFSVAGSAGVAALQTGMMPSDLMHKADQALYVAKRGGRGKVEVA